MAIRQLLLLCVAASGPAHAWTPELLSLALRSKVSEERVLGKEQTLSFNAHDLAATLRLPWEGGSWAGWDVGARLMASAGVLRGAGDSTLLLSAVPTLALARTDLPITVELGAGLALLGKHDYAGQDYGGHLQFALAVGLSLPVHRRIGIGYRFMHYSDAGAYGRHSIGADFHMVELSYRFR
jgi:hypothetical protein